MDPGKDYCPKHTVCERKNCTRFCARVRRSGLFRGSGLKGYLFESTSRLLAGDWRRVYQVLRGIWSVSSEGTNEDGDVDSV